MNYTQHLAAEVRAEAARQRVSGRALAGPIEASTGLGRNSVARMLSGNRPWDVNSLSVAAQVLNISVATLIERVEKATAENRCSLPSEIDSVSSQVTALERMSA